MVMRKVERAIDHPQIRSINRISNAYAITLFETLMRYSPLDPIDTIIVSIVIARNVDHVNNSRELSARYADWDHPVPDAERRPISRRAIAGSLNLPVETVRRRVAALIADGHLAEVKGGVIAPGEGETDPARTEVYYAFNFQLFRRMITQFRSHKIDLTNDSDAEPAA